MLISKRPSTDNTQGRIQARSKQCVNIVQFSTRHTGTQKKRGGGARCWAGGTANAQYHYRDCPVMVMRGLSPVQEVGKLGRGIQQRHAGAN